MTIPQLTIDELIAPQTQAQWLANMLANDATVGLETTSWNSGDYIRTILTVMSFMYASEDGNIAIYAQSGFLQFCATGTVQLTTTKGDVVTVYVTPDPSIPAQNPTGAPGWLDALANSVYDVQRIQAQPAAQNIAFVNTTSVTPPSYAIGAYHVADASTANTFTNTAAMTLSPSSTIGGSITGTSNTAPISVSTSGAHGLVNGSQVYVGGVLGNTAANGFQTVTVTGSNSFSLNNTTGNGAYGGGGTVYSVALYPFVADNTGTTAGNEPAGSITQTITANAGVYCSNYLPFVGVDWESNLDLADRCTLAIQTLSPGGPKGAVQYFAETASSLLAEQTPPLGLTSPITDVLVSLNNTTGIQTAYVANANGPVSGCVQLAITAATNATPIQITVAGHGLSTGAYAIVAGVGGNTNANGSWVITVVDANNFTLNTSSGNAAYTSGGYVEGGDLGLVDSIVQANAVPDLGTTITASCSGVSVPFVATIAVPAAQVATYTTVANQMVVAFVEQFGIGGHKAGGVIGYNDFIGVLYAASLTNGQPTYIPKISGVLLNGTNADYTYPLPIDFVVPAITLTVQGV
jgi:hypothetical protein